MYNDYDDYLNSLSPEEIEKIACKEDEIIFKQTKKKDNNELYNKLDTIPNFMSSKELNEKFVEGLFKLLVKKDEIKAIIDKFNELVPINETNYMKRTIINSFFNNNFDFFWEFFADIYELLEEKFEEMHKHRNDSVDTMFTDCLISKEDYECIDFAFSQFILYVFNKILRKKPFLSVSLMLTIEHNEYDCLASLGIDESALQNIWINNIGEEKLYKNVTQLLYTYIFNNEMYTNYYLNHLGKILFYTKYDFWFFSSGKCFSLSKEYKNKIYEYINIWIINPKVYFSDDLPLILMNILKLPKEINFKLLKFMLETINDMEYLEFPYIEKIINTFNEREKDIITSYIVMNEVK